MEWDKTKLSVNGKPLCYHKRFSSHLSFSKFDRFTLQFARDAVTHSGAVRMLQVREPERVRAQATVVLYVTESS